MIEIFILFVEPFLSVDRIKLHDVPLHSPIRRIIFLENRSVTTAAHFNWSGINQLVKIEPKSGTLEPEQRQLVMVEFKVESDNGPAFHNIELSCHVTSQNDQAQSWKKRFADFYKIFGTKFQFSIFQEKKFSKFQEKIEAKKYNFEKTTGYVSKK